MNDKPLYITLIALLIVFGIVWLFSAFILWIMYSLWWLITNHMVDNVVFFKWTTLLTGILMLIPMISSILPPKNN
jgi:hypothetical protein